MKTDFCNRLQSRKNVNLVTSVGGKRRRRCSIFFLFPKASQNFHVPEGGKLSEQLLLRNVMATAISSTVAMASILDEFNDLLLKACQGGRFLFTLQVSLSKIHRPRVTGPSTGILCKSLRLPDDQDNGPTVRFNGSMDCVVRNQPVGATRIPPSFISVFSFEHEVMFNLLIPGSFRPLFPVEIAERLQQFDQQFPRF